MLKSETTTLFSCLIEIGNCVSKTTCLHCNNRCASDKEFVLDNTTRFEFAGHEAEIATNIDQWTISEEQLWIAPEVIGISVAEVVDSLSTSLRVFFFYTHVSTKNDLNFSIGGSNEFFSTFDNQVNTFLFGNTSNETKETERIIELFKREVFLLDFFLRFQMVLTSWKILNHFETFLNV